MTPTISIETITVEDIARICQDVCCQFNAAGGDDTTPAWADLPQEAKDGIIEGVLGVIENPDVTAEQAYLELYQAECEEQEAAGYVGLGCDFLPAIPPRQLLWDKLFRGIVLALKPMLPVIEPDRTSVSLDFAATFLVCHEFETVDGNLYLRVHDILLRCETGDYRATYTTSSLPCTMREAENEACDVFGQWHQQDITVVPMPNGNVSVGLHGRLAQSLLRDGMIEDR